MAKKKPKKILREKDKTMNVHAWLERNCKAGRVQKQAANDAISRALQGRPRILDDQSLLDMKVDSEVNKVVNELTIFLDMKTAEDVERFSSEEGMQELLEGDSGIKSLIAAHAAKGSGIFKYKEEAQKKLNEFWEKAEKESVERAKILIPKLIRKNKISLMSV